jgi:Peptidase family M1 domain
LQTQSEIDWINERIIKTDSIKWDSEKAKPGVAYPKSWKIYKDSINDVETKTITFKQKNIHDFAWFADKRFLIEKSSVTVAGKKIESFIYYLPKSYQVWHKQCKSINRTLKYLSEHVGEYPYAHASAVEGPLQAGGGMEYPMITIIGPTYYSLGLASVLYHEVGHNWFQGILGSNERDFGFLDEGFNTFYESKIDYSAFIDTTEKGKFYINNKLETVDQYNEGASFSGLSTIRQALVHTDQASTTNSQLLRGNNYGNAIYYKPQSLLAQLQQYLGEPMFEQCMKAYYNQWHHKHPYPADVKKVFTQKSGKNLDWWFDGLLPTTNAIDVKIKKVKQNNDGIVVTIKNKTKTTTPISVDMFKNDSIVYQTIVEPFTSSATATLPNIQFDKIELDGQHRALDINRKNNTYYANGFWKKGKIKAHFLPKLYHRNTAYQVNFNPAIGYNLYNGLMLGTIVSNADQYQQRFKFYAAPLVGLNSKTLEGNVGMGYNWYPKKYMQRISAEMYGSKYAYNASKLNIDNRLFNHVYRLAPQIKLIFKNKHPLKPIVKSLAYKHILLWKNEFDYTQSPVDNLYRPSVGNYQQSYIAQLRYEHTHQRTMNPFSYSAMAQGNQLFAKLSAEANLKMNYNMPNKALSIRVFAGKFFNFAANKYDAWQYRLAGTHTADNDYTFSNYYAGRSSFDHLFAQQITEQEGGMKLTSYKLSNRIGISDDYMFAINLKSDVPFALIKNARIKLPIKPYLDVIAYQNQALTNSTNLQTSFNAGAQLSLLKDRITINIPLVMSKDYSDYFKSTFAKKDVWKNQITFSININQLDINNVMQRFN